MPGRQAFGEPAHPGGEHRGLGPGAGEVALQHRGAQRALAVLAGEFGGAQRAEQIVGVGEHLVCLLLW
jgi:hypothetical protein